MDHGEFTVALSLYMSIIAVCISVLNLFMFKPNDFNPVVLQLELKKRVEKEALDAKAVLDSKIRSSMFTRKANRDNKV